MAVPQLTSQTGGTSLPDTGQLTYNGITWSCLYRSSIDGAVMQDEARRTTKYMAWSLTVEGEVTLNAGQTSTDANWEALRQQLSVHGATLIYTGQGFGGLTVNQPGGRFFDVAWGPVPKIIDFKPLGGGRGAYIKWQVTACVVELKAAPVTAVLKGGIANPGALNARVGTGNPTAKPVLQWNYESSITYDEDGYSGLSIQGTVEIALTRVTPGSRVVSDTVDSYRRAWENIQVDLTKFKVVDRSFNVSRDKRTSQWSYKATELPPMGYPAGSTNAHGSMGVRPYRPNGGRFLTGPLWIVNLTMTYTVRKDLPRRVAYTAFCALLWWRMMSSANGNVSPLDTTATAPQQADPTDELRKVLGDFTAIFANGVVGGYELLLKTMQANQPKNAPTGTFLMDFGWDEGLSGDSKSITFEASWILTCNFATLLRATGLWRWAGDVGGKVWAASVQDIMGAQSWLLNQVNPAADIVVDFGGGQPPQAPPVVR